MRSCGRFLSHVFCCFIFPAFLLSCGGDSDTIVENIIVGSQQSTVVPLYATNGANWNDYVKDDGVDRFTASDTACDPDAVGAACFHAGQIMSMEVPGRTSCDGLTAVDRFDVFDWICDDNFNPIRFVSTGFRPNKGLSDLIDFDAATFLENYLLVYDSNSIISSSLPTVWWGNTVIVNNDGSDGSDMNAGEIHIITQNANATYSFGADKVALLVRPGVTLTGSATFDEIIILATNRNFIWLEGAVKAAMDFYPIYLNATDFSSLHNLSATGAFRSGIFLGSSSNNSLSQINASGNTHGVSLDSSSNNSLSQINASGNAYGVLLYFSSNNSLSQITASGNYHGVYISTSSNNNSLNNITASGNRSFGVYLDSSSNNSLSQITASGNDHGVYISTSSNNNSLNNITASGNSLSGVLLDSSSNNTFTGMLQVGNNTSSDCFVFLGTDPGLVDGTCSDTGLDGSNTYGTSSSDAILTRPVSVASSFVSPPTSDYSLLATDNVIRDVITVPTGNDYFTHTWSDSSTTVMLRNVVEIQGDSIGNDNLLCESNETCLYTPNIAAYQGHGDLVSAGIFSDGAITGVTLMMFETNGY